MKSRPKPPRKQTHAHGRTIYNSQLTLLITTFITSLILLILSIKYTELAGLHNIKATAFYTTTTPAFALLHTTIILLLPNLQADYASLPSTILLPLSSVLLLGTLSTAYIWTDCEIIQPSFSSNTTHSASFCPNPTTGDVHHGLSLDRNVLAWLLGAGYVGLFIVACAVRRRERRKEREVWGTSIEMGRMSHREDGGSRGRGWERIEEGAGWRADRGEEAAGMDMEITGPYGVHRGRDQ